MPHQREEDIFRFPHTNCMNVECTMVFMNNCVFLERHSRHKYSTYQGTKRTHCIRKKKKKEETNYLVSVQGFGLSQTKRQYDKRSITCALPQYVTKHDFRYIS